VKRSFDVRSTRNGKVAAMEDTLGALSEEKSGRREVGSDDPPRLAPTDRAAERQIRIEVREEVGRLLDEQHLLRPRPEDEARIRVVIRERVASYQRRAAVTNTPLIHDPAGLERRLFDGLLRLGPLQPLIEDPAVEEIIVNHPRRVFCIAGGRKRLMDDVSFDDDDEVRQLVKRLVGPLGRRLDESSPMVDARLPDGSRLNAAIPPATTRWCALTIRK
jgi:pilus assembly protein CpaF